MDIGINLEVNGLMLGLWKVDDYNLLIGGKMVDDFIMHNHSANLYIEKKRETIIKSDVYVELEKRYFIIWRKQ